MNASTTTPVRALKASRPAPAAQQPSVQGAFAPDVQDFLPPSSPCWA